MNIEKGTYFNNDGDLKSSLNVRYIKLKEFRLSPTETFYPRDEEGNITGDQTHGFYSIDGEKYNTVEMHGKVLHNFLNVM